MDRIPRPPRADFALTALKKRGKQRRGTSIAIFRIGVVLFGCLTTCLLGRAEDVVTVFAEEPPAADHVEQIDSADWDRLADRHQWSRPTRTAVQNLLDADQERTPEDVVSALLDNSDPRIRRDALEALFQNSITPRLKQQVEAMAESDSDPVSQAKAKLIISDFKPRNRIPTRRPIPVRALPSGLNRRDSSSHSEPQPSSSGKVSLQNFDDDAESADGTGIVRLSNAEFDSAADMDLPPSPERFFPELEMDDADSDVAVAPRDNEPSVLDRSLLEPDDIFTEFPLEGGAAYSPLDAPQGYSGNTSVLPNDGPESEHFVTMPDRWRSGYPRWDRYGKDHPAVDDYPYQEGHWWDPYNLNVLKGDYPIAGQHTFLKFTGQINSLMEYRQLPTPTTPFESTVDPGSEEFFGDPNQFFSTNYFKLSVELFHGDAGFKPIDWAVRMTPIFNLNYLDTQELGIVNADVRRGTTRVDDFMALEEYFVEAKLKDLSPDYDFLSMRVGSQPFVSDFRGFIFADINRGVRLFGTRLANRDQFNLVFFRQAEKDTNSQLNTFDDRNQSVLIANYYRQDFIFPGYTAQWSFHYNNDGPSKKFDNNDFLVRPDPSGVFQPHRVNAFYFGFAGDGHINQFNLSHAFYWAVGHDSQNPIAGTSQNIDAKMGAVELSYDRDWIRFRGSVFYASGDRDPYDHGARGFDTILDSPNFAGGPFSFWQRQQIGLFGVNLVNRNSLVPDLRASKFQGQSNFVNPGLKLLNLGMDFELTPKLSLITNANYLQFDTTRTLEAFTFQNQISRDIGVDLSLGLEYRPLLNDNVIFTGGYACLLPGAGFNDLYGRASPFTTANSSSLKTGGLNSAFMQMILQY